MAKANSKMNDLKSSLSTGPVLRGKVRFIIAGCRDEINRPGGMALNLFFAAKSAGV